MTTNRDERPHLRRDDKEFVERLASSFAPPPLTPPQRLAFAKGLEARLARRRRVKVLVPALAALALAAVVAWLTLPGPFGVRGRGEEEPGTVIAAVRSAAEQWELELLYPVELGDSEERDDSEFLPDDYLAIAGVFLGG